MNIRAMAERIASMLGSTLFARGGVDDDVGQELGWLEPSTDPAFLGRVGRFQVIQLLGSGGTGTVLLAKDPRRNRQVALKVLNPEIANNAAARRRFLREGRIAMSLRHPNVVSTHEIDCNPDHPCIISEFMAGGSLQRLLDQQGPLPLQATIDYGVQMARGLEAIHTKGLVHSDIKPLNILLDTFQHTVKISDFGLARIVAAQRRVEHSTVIATPQYASPEQVQGFRIDRRSDVYSMGGVMYAMCTARPPFFGSSTVAIMRQVCNAQPLPIREINGQIPEWLCQVISKMMSRNRLSRYASAAEVEQVLVSYA